MRELAGDILTCIFQWLQSYLTQYWTDTITLNGSLIIIYDFVSKYDVLVKCFWIKRYHNHSQSWPPWYNVGHLSHNREKLHMYLLQRQKQIPDLVSTWQRTRPEYLKLRGAYNPTNLFFRGSLFDKPLQYIISKRMANHGRNTLLEGTQDIIVQASRQHIDQLLHKAWPCDVSYHLWQAVSESDNLNHSDYREEQHEVQAREQSLLVCWLKFIEWYAFDEYWTHFGQKSRTSHLDDQQHGLISHTGQICLQEF